MSGWFGRARRSKTLRAAATVPAVFAGIVLPVDFLSQVDGYLAYLRPWELFPLFGWAWLFYALLGSAIAILALVLAGSIARVLRMSAAALATHICYWLSASVAALALLRGGKLWLEALHFGTAASWMSWMKWEIVALTLVIFAVLAWRRPDATGGLNRLARTGAVFGLVVALASPLSIMGSPSATPVPPAHHENERAKSKRPDIVMVTIDSLAANHMSLYGYSRPTTPRLDRLGKRATIFERFYANSNYTTPTINSLVNGTRPWTHRANQFLAPVDGSRALQGMGARLRAGGYQTLAVATNTAAAPFSIGNARLFDHLISGRTRTSWYVAYSLVGTHLPRAFNSSGLLLLSTLCDAADRVLVYSGVWSFVDHFDPEVALSAARRLIEDRDRVKPMFLWIHLMPPHAPYATPAPFAGRFDKGTQALTRFDSTPLEAFAARLDRTFPSGFVGRYDEAIAYVDHHVGDFMDWLSRQNMLDDALLVITADHGESFTHEYGQHGGPMLHQDLIHIPLIVKEPGQTTGKRLDVVSEQVDVMPTVLDLVGIPIEGPVEGRSLKAATRGERMKGPVFSMNFQQSNRFGALHTGSIAMIEGRWKYVHYRGQFKDPNMPRLEDSLYDLQADPGEMSNLVATQPDIAARMRAAIEEQLRLHGGPVH